MTSPKQLLPLLVGWRNRNVCERKDMNTYSTGPSPSVALCHASICHHSQIPPTTSRVFHSVQNFFVQNENLRQRQRAGAQHCPASLRLRAELSRSKRAWSKLRFWLGLVSFTLVERSRACPSFRLEFLSAVCPCLVF